MNTKLYARHAMYIRQARTPGTPQVHARYTPGLYPRHAPGMRQVYTPGTCPRHTASTYIRQVRTYARYIRQVHTYAKYIRQVYARSIPQAYARYAFWKRDRK